MKGTTLRGLKVFKAMCGRDNFSGIVLATTFWDQVDDPEKAKALHQDLCNNDNFWGEMVKAGSHTETIPDKENGATSAKRIIKYLIERQMKMTLLIQQQFVLEKMLLHETDAGKVLFDEYIIERSDVEFEIETELENLRQARADFHDQNQIAARDAIKLLKDARVKRQRKIQSLQVDTNHINIKWGNHIQKRLKEMKQEAEKTKLNHDLTEAALKAFEASSTHSSATPSVQSSEFGESTIRGRDGVQIVDRRKGKNGGSVSTLSGVVGTGLALGQFVAMLACTVM
jgi:hypothetical protein